MCQFFSCNTTGDGQLLYFAAEDRKKALKGKLVDGGGQAYEPDSHASIAAAHGLDEDKCNKYEYNPLTRVFTIDYLNVRDDSKAAGRACEKLDFKTIVPELVIRPIVHPFDRKRRRVTAKDKKLLREWDSVGASVWASVGASAWASAWASVGASVRASVGASAWASAWASVWDSVGDSVGDSVWDSVGASVGASVWDSVGDSVGAYMSSFFVLKKWRDIKHKPGENPYQSCIDLWERGLVPSFDGKTWRLHAPQVIYEWTPRR